MKKILVVEDEYYARKSIVKILQESDLDIQVCGEAENGMKAIELLEEYKDIALVITDIQMQKMGGLELASYLHKHIPEIDVLILTAFENFDYAREALRYNVKDYIVKPIYKENLLPPVKKVLEKQEEKSRNQEKIKNYYQWEAAKNYFPVKTIVAHEELYKEFFSYNAIHQEEKFCIVVMQEEELVTDVELVNRIIQEKYRGFIKDFFFSKINEEYVMLLSGIECMDNELIVQEKVESMLSYFCTCKHMNITMGVGLVYSSKEKIYQKDCFMEEIRKIKASIVEIVDIDDICENGIVCEMDKVNAIVDKMKNRKIDALFFPFCDFGEEQVVAAIASKFTVPILIWGPRDERPNTDEARGRDTQCGMFAATKVLQRYGLKYSYIYNCTTKSEEFLKGYETFIRTAAVLKSLRTLRIAKIGERPVPFMSVMTNEANLIKRFGITTVPISPVEICNRARKILEEKGKEYIKYEEEFVRKFPDGENYQQICATKLAVQELMEENNCSVAAFECWSAFPTLMGLCPCVVLGEMADNGMPLSCETDINGAITLAILRACNLFEESEFLADLTIRHPQNDNAELLWHCGPFPYSLKKDGVEAKLVDGQERFELKQGDLTVCRFDDVDGEYYLFAGEAKTTTGPETNGTYVWMETDNWKRWEEKLMFGPYIHHLGCVYGHYLPVLREVSRYLGIHFDNAHEQGIYSL